MLIYICPQLNMLLPRVVNREYLLYLVQRANRRDENCDSILSFALPNDVMFKIG